MKQLFYIIFFALLLFFSCKKDPITNDPTPAPLSSIQVNLNNMVDDSLLVLNKNYFTSAGDSFMVSKFKYYLSNFVFTLEDGSEYTEPESYHLIRHTNGISSFTITQVPLGGYKAVRFMIGVDSTHNVSGTQPGDLESSYASDMFWTWSSGYIFLKLEGTAPKSPASDKLIEYHIGGYGGKYKTQRDFNFNFGFGRLNVLQTKLPVLNLKVNVNEIFKTPVAIDFSSLPTVVAGGFYAKQLADNYADMISLKSIDNP